MNEQMAKEREKMRITCEYCKYVSPDKSASEWRWTAYKCSNKESDYYGSLLNVTYNGDKLDWICWTGCEHGELDAMAMPAYFPEFRLAT